jgi:hypothetical protein
MQQILRANIIFLSISNFRNYFLLFLCLVSIYHINICFIILKLNFLYIKVQYHSLLSIILSPEDNSTFSYRIIVKNLSIKFMSVPIIILIVIYLCFIIDKTETGHFQSVFSLSQFFWQILSLIFIGKFIIEILIFIIQIFYGSFLISLVIASIFIMLVLLL